jgi:hypothetical protein
VFLCGVQGYEGEITAVAEHAILTSSLKEFNVNSGQLQVHHCLEMRHHLADGVQRVRCYPFSGHQFHGLNPMDAIFFIPVTHHPSEFELPKDKDQIEYGKVLLFFKIIIPGRRGRWRTIECAFIKYFEKYLVKGESFDDRYCIIIV